MDKAKTMKLSLEDVYQLLVSDLRYGYRRNNHLMPHHAYSRIRELIPQMYKIDKDYALNTLSQLCEECISDQLLANFYDGYDDEFGNRKEAIEFTLWGIKWIHEHGDEKYKPYCFESLEHNISLDDAPRYNVYELVDGKMKLLTEKPVSKNEYPDYIFTEENIDAKKSATYHRIVLRGNPINGEYIPYGKAPIKYEFLTPTQKVYIVEHVEVKYHE